MGAQTCIKNLLTRLSPLAPPLSVGVFFVAGLSTDTSPATQAVLGILGFKQYQVSRQMRAAGVAPGALRLSKHAADMWWSAPCRPHITGGTRPQPLPVCHSILLSANSAPSNAIPSCLSANGALPSNTPIEHKTYTRTCPEAPPAPSW